MLAKLCLDVDYLPLSKMSGISRFNVYNVFIMWVNFCSRQCSEVATWPEKDVVSCFGPDDKFDVH